MFKLLYLFDLVGIQMLLSEDRERRLEISTQYSDRSKEDVPTDNCSSFSSSNYQYLLKSQQSGLQLEPHNMSQKEAKVLTDRLNRLRLVQQTMAQKFEMCIKKLEYELDSKQAQNDFLRGEISTIRQDVKETKKDILLIKQYLSRDSVEKTKAKRLTKYDLEKEKKFQRYHKV